MKEQAIRVKSASSMSASFIYVCAVCGFSSEQEPWKPRAPWCDWKHREMHWSNEEIRP